jgi:predicted enzyme related to lactoylglutathione lyase
MRPARPVIHLELHTGNLPQACSFYQHLFGWQPERIEVGASSYQSLELGGEMGGGVVESGAVRSLWLPYVAVPDLEAATERARKLGAAVPLEPREGPAGWRSVIASHSGAEVGLWQPKENPE